MAPDALVSRARRYRWLAAVLLVALTVPRMAQRGMFLDGMVYASVSRNLAIGAGHFWAPRYTATTYAAFYEEPALGLWLESLAFRVIGDHPSTERVYSLALFALTAGFIVAIWRRALPRHYDWLPLFFWILPSIVTWAVVNNMLENTQAAFTCAAVLALLVAGFASRPWAAACWATLGALAVVGAVFVKGPVGFFPLALPVLMPILPAPGWPTHRPVAWAVFLGALVAAALVVAATPASRYAVSQYLHIQLLPSLRGEREIDPSRLGILRHLVGGIALRLGVVIGVLLLVRRRGVTMEPLPRASWFFLAVGLSASLPLAITPKMMGQYFVPSVPFFSLAAAAFALPAIRTWGDEGARSGMRHLPTLLGAALLLTMIAVLAVHGPIEPRDVRMVHDVDTVAEALPTDQIVGTCGESALDWGLRAYLERFLRVSLDATGQPVEGRFLQYHGACSAPPPCRAVAGQADMVVYRCSGGPAEAFTHVNPHG